MERNERVEGEREAETESKKGFPTCSRSRTIKGRWRNDDLREMKSEGRLGRKQFLVESRTRWKTEATDNFPKMDIMFS